MVDEDGKYLSTPVELTTSVMGMYWGDGGLLSHYVDAGAQKE
jgi:hypothetical protein